MDSNDLLSVLTQFRMFMDLSIDKLFREAERAGLDIHAHVDSWLHSQYHVWDDLGWLAKTRRWGKTLLDEPSTEQVPERWKDALRDAFKETDRLLEEWARSPQAQEELDRIFYECFDLPHKLSDRWREREEETTDGDAANQSAG